MAVLLRRDFDASRLRGLAKKTKDGPQARRLLALAAIYDGATRTEAAKIGGVGLQIIRDWVMRFTKSTRVVQLDELPASWRPSQLNQDHMADPHNRQRVPVFSASHVLIKD